jgi:capsular polysaccharide biosynthesis protein
LNLRDYLLIVRRRKWIGILVLVAALGTSATLTTLATPLYQARASLFLGPQGTVTPTDSVNPVSFATSLGIAERLVKTYSLMIRSRTVADLAVQGSGLDLTPAYVLSHTAVVPLPDTQLIEIRVTDPEPVRAANIANAVGEAFAEYSKSLTSAPGGSTPLVPVTLFEDAVTPTGPVSPSASRNLGLAGVLGAVAAIALMFTAEYLDVAVRGPDDVERLVHLPVVAMIPRITRDDVSRRKVDSASGVRVAP